MNELFYTDLGKAIFMAENHAVIMATIKGSPYHATPMIIAMHGKGKRHYVHQDSHEILKPQVNDWGKTVSGLWCFFDEDAKDWFSAGYGISRVVEPVEIIHRNGKAFFPAETEVADDE